MKSVGSTKYFTLFQIALDDGLPQCICSVCKELVSLALSLRSQSQTTDKILKQAGHKITTATPNFSDSEILECEEWPVTKTKDSQKNYLKLEHDNIYLNSNQKDLNVECQIDLELKSNSKGKSKKGITNAVEHNMPVSEVLLEIKNEKAGKQPGMSKKAKRAMYMELVEGVFDPKGPVKCKVCKKTVSKWACFVSHAKLHLGFKFVCEVSVTSRL